MEDDDKNKYDDDLLQQLLVVSSAGAGAGTGAGRSISTGSGSASVPSSHNVNAISPVRKRTSSFHSAHSRANSLVSVDDLARAMDSNVDSNNNSMIIMEDYSYSSFTNTNTNTRHRRNHSIGRRSRQQKKNGMEGGGEQHRHARYASWGGQSAQQRLYCKPFFDPNDPLAPPIARKKVNSNKSSAFRGSSSLPNTVIPVVQESLVVSHHQQQQPVSSSSNKNNNNKNMSDDNVSDISPMSPPTTTNVAYTFDKFLSVAVQAANDDDGMVVTNASVMKSINGDNLSVSEGKSQIKPNVSNNSPPASGTTSSPYPMNLPPNVNEISTQPFKTTAFDSDESSSSIDSELLIPPRGSGTQRPRRLNKKVAKNPPIMGHRERISSSGTISSVEDYYREIGASLPTSLPSGTSHFSHWDNYSPHVQKQTYQENEYDVDDNPDFIEGFDFDKNDRPSLDSSGHHGSEIMTYSVKSLSYGDEIEDGIYNPSAYTNTHYGSIMSQKNLDVSESIGKEQDVPFITRNDTSEFMKLKQESMYGPTQSKDEIDRVFSSVRSVSTVDVEAELNDCEVYMMSDVLKRAFPDRLIALLVTLVIEIPVLLMINGGSGRICKLIGRRRYQLLIAFLPLASAVSGNCGLQGSSLTTRAISHSHVTRKTYAKWLMMEIGVASFLGLIMGIIMGVFAFVSSGMDAAFGVTIGIGQFLSILTAGLTGTTAPLLFTFIFKRDSGKWSGPLETAIQDIVGSFAMVVLSYHIILWFGPQEVEPWDTCGADG